MARQVLTLPDVPPTLLTQSAGDARYLQPATAAATYLPLAGGTLTGTLTVDSSVADQYGLVVLNDRARASFQADTDTVLGRVGVEYAGSGVVLSTNMRTGAGFTGSGWHRDDPTKLAAALTVGSGTTILNLASVTAGGTNPATLINRVQVGTTGTLTVTPNSTAAALVAQGHIGIGVTPEAGLLPITSQAALRIGSGANLWGNIGGTSLAVADNSYWNGGYKAVYGNIAGSHWTQYAGETYFMNAPAVAAGAAQTMTERFRINTSGTLTLTPAANAGLTINSFNLAKVLSLYFDGGPNAHVALTSGSVLVFDGIPNLLPGTDNYMSIGGPSPNRCSAIWAVNGTIQTSHVSLKEGFVPLDPAACAGAVLGTDWVGFAYREPPPPEGADPDEHRERVAHLAFASRQRGYVLGSPDHKVSDLFGLADREHTSVSSDLAVVACALQDALRRVAALEASR